MEGLIMRYSHNEHARCPKVGVAANDFLGAWNHPFWSSRSSTDLFKLTYWKVIMIIFVAQVPQLLRLKLRMVPSTGWIMLTVMETKIICLPVLTYDPRSVRKESGLGWLALQHLRVVLLKTDLQFFDTIIIFVRAQITLMLSWHRPPLLVTQLVYFRCNPKFFSRLI